MLVSNLTFDIRKGESWIIRGPSGCGKSSLLRTLSGLWPVESGRIIKPENNEEKYAIFFLPQVPYMVQGTLKDQILYPDCTPENLEQVIVDDDIIVSCLKLSGLGYLLPRYGWNTVEKWDSLLSLGEQQRLASARLFYHKPNFVVLDESTSAMDEENEKNMYRTINDLNITPISVGHRESVLQYHDHQLIFDGLGNYKIVKVDTVKYEQEDKEEIVWDKI